METEVSLLFSQEPTIDAYPEPGESSPSLEALCNISLKAGFYGEELVALCPSPKLEDHPVIGCPRLLIQYASNNSPYLKSISSVKAEDALCRCDRGPHSTTTFLSTHAESV
jgi:hypothetical protein